MKNIKIKNIRTRIANTTKRTAFHGRAKIWTSVSPITVKGGVVRVIDSAVGDIAMTTVGWIEDEKYGWYTTSATTAWSAEFDTAVTRTGTKTLKLSNTDATGKARSWTGKTLSGTPVLDANKKYLIPLKSSTSYKLNVYSKTNNVAAFATYFSIYMYKSADFTTSAVASVDSNKLTGTNDWTLLTKTFTTNADCGWGEIILRNDVAGNISDAWFDVNSMILEEVTSITNTALSPVLYYPSLTAVTSTDNIDQSQLVSDNTRGLGTAGQQKVAQQLLPTKKNFYGVVCQRSASTGTYIGNVTFSIQADSSGSPSGVDLASSTVTNATWGAISNDTDFTVSFPTTLTIGGTTKYWIVVSSSTVDASNYTRLKIGNANPYGNGLLKEFNGTVWGADVGADLYFKTLYSKNTTNLTVSTDTETVSVTAPTTDGWADTSTIDVCMVGNQTPITLAPGANNIYVSSNGPSTADGTVDASLQGTLSGSYVI